MLLIRMLKIRYMYTNFLFSLFVNILKTKRYENISNYEI